MFNPLTGTSIKSWSQLLLAEKMNVSVLRISNVQLTYDDANIFITATLLDKTDVAGIYRHKNITNRNADIHCIFSNLSLMLQTCVGKFYVSEVDL